MDARCILREIKEEYEDWGLSINESETAYMVLEGDADVKLIIRWQ